MVSSLPLSTARSIAIIRRNGLGDLLCAMPVLEYCRRQSPEAKITLIVEHRNAPLLPFLRGFDRSVVLPRGNKYLSALAVGALHWWPRVDIAIATKPTPTRLMSFALWALRARHRVAAVNDKWYCRFINHPVPLDLIPEGKIHQALAALRMLDPNLHEIPKELWPKLTLDAPFQAGPVSSMRDLLAFGDLSLPLLFVSLTNNRAASSLGVEGHTEILNRLATKTDFRVVISCEPRDLPKAQDLLPRLKCAAKIIASRNVNELIAILSLVDNVLVGDGGIMHLAAALDKPQTVLFGHDIVTQWHPLSDKATCLVSTAHVLDIPKEVIVDSVKQRFV